MRYSPGDGLIPAQREVVATKELMSTLQTDKHSCDSILIRVDGTIRPQICPDTVALEKDGAFVSATGRRAMRPSYLPPTTYGAYVDGFIVTKGHRRVNSILPLERGSDRLRLADFEAGE